jgi:hypothetical protein
MVRSKSQLPKCYSVLEEALESRHHFIADKIVYVEQFRVLHDDPFAGVTEIDANLHRWLQLDVWFCGERKTHYTAIICPCGKRRNLGGMREFHVKSCGFQRDPAMLVDVPEPIQPPQFSGYESVPCMVWLKRFDDLQSLARNALSSKVEASSPPSVVQVDNGKAGSVVVGSARTERECCSEMVQRSSKTCNPVSNNKGEVNRRRGEIEGNHILASIKVILGRERIGLRITPQVASNLFIQKAKVVLCPTHLESSIEITWGVIGMDVR